jgi:hypothetical protein
VNRTALVGIGFVLVVIAAVVLATMGQAAYRVEVCMEFQGASSCRTASASTKPQAERTARENACAQIASGVTDRIQCEQYTQAKRVTWLRGGDR